MKKKKLSYKPVLFRSFRSGEATGTFLSSVYRWMALGLGITTFTAYAVAQNPVWTGIAMQHPFFMLFAQFGLVFVLARFAERLDGVVAGGLFALYSFITGVTFSVLFFAYTQASIAGAFATTALSFGALSLYGATTKKSLSGWSTFLMMGLWGVLIAGLVNFFLQSSGLSFVVSCASVVVFAGLAAYDTQQLKQYHLSSPSPSPIAGALMLYLDFINLFLALLRIFGDRRD